MFCIAGNTSKTSVATGEIPTIAPTAMPKSDNVNWTVYGCSGIVHRGTLEKWPKPLLKPVDYLFGGELSDSEGQESGGYP